MLLSYDLQSTKSLSLCSFYAKERFQSEQKRQHCTPQQLRLRSCVNRLYDPFSAHRFSSQFLFSSICRVSGLQRNISPTLPPHRFFLLLLSYCLVSPPFLFFFHQTSLSLSSLSVCSIIISMVTNKDGKLSLTYYGSNLLLSSACSLSPLLSSVAFFLCFLRCVAARVSAAFCFFQARFEMDLKPTFLLEVDAPSVVELMQSKYKPVNILTVSKSIGAQCCVNTALLVQKYGRSCTTGFRVVELDSLCHSLNKTLHYFRSNLCVF